MPTELPSLGDFAKIEDKALKRAAKKSRSEPLKGLARMALDGNPIAPKELTPVVSALEAKQLKPWDILAAAILCRRLTAGTDDADRASKAFADEIGRLEFNAFGAGCLLLVLGIIIAIFASSSSSNTTNSTSVAANSGAVGIMLTTLVTLRSPRGAQVAGQLALTETRGRPQDLGTIAIAALPPLLEAATQCKPGDLSKGDIEIMGRLESSTYLSDEIKSLAAKVVAAVSPVESGTAEVLGGRPAELPSEGSDEGAGSVVAE